MHFKRIYHILRCQYLEDALIGGNLQYKDKIKRFTSSIHTVFGTAMHESMQYYLDYAYEKSFAAADRNIDLKEDFQDRYISEYQVQYKKNNDSHFSMQLK